MTLTEISIALAVITTVAAAGVPPLRRSHEHYVRTAAAHMVAAKLQAARIAAVSGSRDCRLSVPSATAYALECQAREWQVLERVALPRGLTITANARPEFHPRGNVAPTATLFLWSASGRSTRVIVNALGRVRIE